MEEANREKLRSEVVAVTTEEANAWLLFSSCGCTEEVTLNIDWQMAVLSKNVNMDFTDGIASLAALYWVENFKLCNKHQSLLARHLGFVIKGVPNEELVSQMDNIWQYRNLLDFTLLVRKKPEWFQEQVQEIISGMNKLE